MNAFVNPAELDKEDPRRNTPLGELRAEYRNLQGNLWRAVYRGEEALPMPVSQFTYNQLCGPWVVCNEWRIPTV